MMVTVRLLILSLLFVSNLQASNQYELMNYAAIDSSDKIVDDEGLKLIVCRNRSVFLHNDLVNSLHSDNFRKLCTPTERATYLKQLREDVVARHNNVSSVYYLGLLRDNSNARPVYQCDGKLYWNPHMSSDRDRQEMSNLLWIRNKIRRKQQECDKTLIDLSICSQNQLNEIKKMVYPLKLKRNCIQHCLGDDDSSDEDYLVDRYLMI